MPGWASCEVTEKQFDAVEEGQEVVLLFEGSKPTRVAVSGTSAEA